MRFSGFDISAAAFAFSFAMVLLLPI